MLSTVILVMFVVFSPVASNFLYSLVMLPLIARLAWAVLGMYSVSFLLLPLIRTVLLLGFDLGRLTDSETFLLLRNRMKQTFRDCFRHKGE